MLLFTNISILHLSFPTSCSEMLFPPETLHKDISPITSPQLNVLEIHKSFPILFPLQNHGLHTQFSLLNTLQIFSLLILQHMMYLHKTKTQQLFTYTTLNIILKPPKTHTQTQIPTHNNPHSKIQAKYQPRQSRRLQGLKPDIASLATQVTVPDDLFHCALSVLSQLPTSAFPDSSSKLEFALQTLQEAEPALGDPGSDPLPFLPEPNRIPQILKLPEDVREAWLKAFNKEIRGLIMSNKCFKIEQAPADARVVPLMELFKCKLDKFGKVDKLKCRIVFRGDLYSPTEDLDSWNPHATWTSLKYFLGLCAHFRIFPAQIDFEMAYVQIEMREEHVYVKFPDFWQNLVPPELQAYMGTPLLLLKAH